ncbi:alpha/beta fold hydrolase [Streptomyces sp. NPDC059564]|uniref:alpha/beta fold hydrolase n=1 Tax=Streptomyces sp. NPDC059564 TaxID=3346865 RepID=UPI0036CC1911
MSTKTPIRSELTIDGRRLSYLDFGGAGRPLVALHGHLSEGASFAHLAEALGDEWRVIAPDQRGHGDSDRADGYERAGYLADLVALLEHLNLGPVPVIGHSLGGINAYHLAAARPELVSALVNVDAPVDLPHREVSPLAFLAALPYTAPTREELLAACGPVGPMLAPGMRPLPGGEGWRLSSHPLDTLDSEEHVHGDHWKRWLGSDCPALLVHGRDSQALPGAQAAAMVERRPGTALVILDTDHFVQLRDPAGFEAAVRTFLAGL